MNTLVVHPGALGDVLLSRKAMKGLRQALPHNTLVWVGRTDIGNLLLACGEIHSAISLEGPFLSDLFSPSHQWSTQTHEILKRCTHVVCWLNDAAGDNHQQHIRPNLIEYGIPSVITQSPYDLSLTSTHIEDRYEETLHSWQISMFECSDRLRIIDSSYDGWINKGVDDVLAPLHKRIVIHPGSGSPHKCADTALFILMVQQLLKKRHREIIILKGPADKEAVNNLCVALPSGAYRVLQHQSLNSAVQYFSSIDLFIGNDSGMTHLAIACGVPSIALFGPTDPAQWASRESHVAVIQGERCQCGDWSNVRSCASKPCLNISVDQVIEEAERWLCLPKNVEFPSFQIGNIA